jgi:hypothetical protein
MDPREALCKPVLIKYLVNALNLKKKKYLFNMNGFVFLSLLSRIGSTENGMIPEHLSTESVVYSGK